MQLEYKDKYGKEKWYELREVYYNGEDKVWAWSADPETFSFQSIEDIKELKEKILLAMAKPILSIKKDKEGKEYTVELKKDYI